VAMENQDSKKVSPGGSTDAAASGEESGSKK
jgi:hypothetical protein